MESAPSPSPVPPDRPWDDFARNLELVQARASHRPLRVRVRWEVYDHTSQRYVHVKGSAFTYTVRQRTDTLAERLWRAVQVVLG